MKHEEQKMEFPKSMDTGNIRPLFTIYAVQMRTMGDNKIDDYKMVGIYKMCIWYHRIGQTGRKAVGLLSEPQRTLKQKRYGRAAPIFTAAKHGDETKVEIDARLATLSAVFLFPK
jgi:hypothetical protein